MMCVWNGHIAVYNSLLHANIELVKSRLKLMGGVKNIL